MDSFRRPSLIAFASTAGGMWLYEYSKQLLFPSITLWQSHGLTILLSAVAATVAVRRALRENNRLQRDAYYDRLTGLLNRNGFMDRVETQRRRAQADSAHEFALLFIDSDKFKSVNDSLGHSAGDALIRAMGLRIKAQLGPRDLLGRFGGDEFVVLQHGVNDADQAIAFADRIRDAMVDPFFIRGEEISSSVSIGVAMCDAEYAHAEEIARDADLAMYRAKASGRGRSQLFLPNMRTALMRRIALERDMGRAIERGQLRVLYQPIVALESGEITGFEALLRWHHPIHNIIPPTEFIPLAEENGLIVSIGASVLQIACAQGAEWARRYPAAPPSVSVNVSPRQLRHAEFVQTVAGCARGEWTRGGPSASGDYRERARARRCGIDARGARRARGGLASG